jgi:hypothetical protein
MISSRVRLPLRFNPLALQADVDALGPDAWVAHFNTDYYEGEWSGVALRSAGGAPLALYPDPAASAADWVDTEVLSRSTALATAVGAFECSLRSVRLLRLGAGASIREHSDFRLGYEDGEVRVHVPITTSADVEFLHDGYRMEMAPGEAWYMDFNLPHSVANHGDKPRVHLVIDCVLNDWLDRQLHARSVAGREDALHGDDEIES